MLSEPKYKLKKLEKVYSGQILLVLYDKGRMFRTELYRELGNNNKSIGDRADALIEMGLLKETVETDQPFRNYVELTERGRKIAEHLAAIEPML